MEKKNMMNNKNNLNKSIGICIIGSVLSFIIGSIMANIVHTKISIPLGIIMMYIPAIIIIFFALVLNIKELNKKSWLLFYRNRY